MADTKITQLQPPQGGYPVVPATDVLPIVVIADPGMATSGSTRKVTVNQLLGAGGTATLASATITGDLTVDTSTLKVDSANNRVGIGTASPAAGYTLDVVGSSRITGPGVTLTLDKTGAAALQLNASGNAGSQLSTSGTGGLLVYTANGIGGALDVRHQIASDGVATWSNVGGVTGTAMTLNSTGLTIGGSAIGKLTAYSTTNGDVLAAFRCTGTGTQRGLYISADNSTGIVSVDATGAAAGILQFKTGGTNTMQIDSSGNVGIGGTPQLWNTSYKGVQVGLGANFYSNAGTPNNGWFATNTYQNAANTTTFIGTGYGMHYRHLSGEHAWLTSTVSGSAGVAATMNQFMTLDVSGNLLVGTTSGSFGSRLIISTDSGTTKWATGPFPGGPTNYYITANNAQGVFLNGTTATAWSGISDERFKDIIEPISNAIAKVGSLRSVIGKFKTDSEGTRRPFLIAQDLLSVFPEAVVTNDPDKLAVTYTEVIPLLVAAIKELTARVQTLETR